MAKDNVNHLEVKIMPTKSTINRGKLEMLTSDGEKTDFLQLQPLHVHKEKHCLNPLVFVTENLMNKKIPEKSCNLHWCHW